MQNAEALEQAVIIRRRLNAPVDIVYRVWTDPRFASRWSWGAAYTSMFVDIDCRMGGAWRQVIRHKETGEVWSFEGQFREVVPNAKLVHTFHWTNDRAADEGKSLVAIEFLSRGQETEVVITHTQLQTQKQRKGTQAGWLDILECVERCLPSTNQPDAEVPR